MKKTLSLILGTLLLASLLGGCTTGERQTTGIAGGAVVGGVAGSALTGGSAVGTIVGAGAGAVAGNYIAK